MNVDQLNQFMLSIFFTYLILMSANIHTLLGCSTQKFLRQSVYVKHIILFASIYILTFILDWYTHDAIVVHKEGFNDNGDYNYLISSLKYSIIIYFCFLATTKMTPYFFVTFILLIVVAFTMYLILKVNIVKYDIKFNTNNNILIDRLNIVVNYENENNEKIITNVLYLYNSLVIVYIFMISLVVIGFIKYYMKQRKSKGKDFDILKFIFGRNHCDHE